MWRCVQWWPRASGVWRSALMGDVAPAGEGVSELRLRVGAGWRVYFVQRGAQVIVLLAGGSKRTQKADIKRARALASELD